MTSSSHQPTDSILLSSEQIAQLEKQYPGVSKTMRGFQQKASEAQTAQPALGTQAERIDYAALKQEHANLISSGASSVEIAQWLGDRLNITNWKEGKFHGERKVLSTPTGEEMARLQEFTKALGKSWTGANGGSDNHSDFLLLDGHIQNALFGQANMQKVNARLDTFHTDWQAMKKDFAAKAEYLKVKVGLDIRGDWSKLTGVRYDVGGFDYSVVLYASGALYGDIVLRLFVGQRGSDVDLGDASFARLCFLA